MDLEKSLYKLHKSFEKKIERFTVVKNYQVAALVFFIGIIVFEFISSGGMHYSLVKYLGKILFFTVLALSYAFAYYFILTKGFKSKIKLHEAVYVVGVVLLILAAVLTLVYIVNILNSYLPIISPISGLFSTFFLMFSVYTIFKLFKLITKLGYLKLIGAVIGTFFIVSNLFFLVVAPYYIVINHLPTNYYYYYNETVGENSSVFTYGHKFNDTGNFKDYCSVEIPKHWKQIEITDLGILSSELNEYTTTNIYTFYNSRYNKTAEIIHLDALFNSVNSYSCKKESWGLRTFNSISEKVDNNTYQVYESENKIGSYVCDHRISNGKGIIDEVIGDFRAQDLSFRIIYKSDYGNEEDLKWIVDHIRCDSQ